MGNPGSVAYLFELKAIFQFEQYDDEHIELAINNNCLDIQESKMYIFLMAYKLLQLIH